MIRLRPSTAALLSGLSAAALLLAALQATATDTREVRSMPIQTQAATAARLQPLDAAAAATPRPLERDLVALPDGFAPAATAAVTLDGRPARLWRYERADGRNTGLGGEHVSLLTGAEGALLGYTRMEAALAEGPLPDAETAEAAALAFLERAAPDLLAARELQWIEPHSETLPRTAAGEGLEVTGMKVKLRNAADGTYFWVIVGPGAEIVTFERDIVWITFPGRRQTEKWLHDAWLAEQAATG